MILVFLAISVLNGGLSDHFRVKCAQNERYFKRKTRKPRDKGGTF